MKDELYDWQQAHQVELEHALELRRELNAWKERAEKAEAAYDEVLARETTILAGCNALCSMLEKERDRYKELYEATLRSPRP